MLRLEYLPEIADSSGARRGRTLLTRLDGAWLDYRWSQAADGRSAIEAVIEHGCAACPGVPRPATRSRHGAADDAPSVGTEEPDPIANLTVESLGADTATVALDGGASRFAVRFDRRARPVAIAPLAPHEEDDGSEATAVEAALRLAEVGTVDGAGLAFRARRGTSCPPPLFRTCEELAHDQQMAILSDCVYQAPPCGGKDIGDWEVVPYGDLGRPPLTRNDFVQTNRSGEDRGFYSRPYRNKKTGELVVAFRGTEPEWRDIVADINQLQHGYSDQYKRAQKLAERLEAGGVNSVTYTGHSLGGGLATTAAASTRQESVTFNAAALSPATAETLSIEYSEAKKAALNYVVPGEAVTALQDIPWRPGTTVGRDDDYGGRPRQTSTPAPGPRYVLRPPHPSTFQHYVSAPDWLKNMPVIGIGARWAERAGNLHRSIFVLSAMEETIQHQCGAATP